MWCNDDSTLNNLCYFQAASGAGTQYSATMTNTLNVARAAIGEPACWERPTTKHNWQPKTFIVTDWSLAARDKKKAIAILTSLLNLHGGAHPLYVWQKNRLAAIASPSDLGQLDLANITPISRVALQEQLPALGVTCGPDAIAVLDYFTLRKLTGDTNTCDELHLTDVIKSQHPKAALYSVVTEQNFTLRLYDSDLDKGKALIEQANALNLYIKDDLFPTNLSPAVVGKLSDLFPRNLSPAVIGKLKKVEVLCLRRDSAENALRLMSRCPAIEVFRLQAHSDEIPDSAFVVLKPNSLLQLKDIVLPGSQFSTTSLFVLLRAGPNLEKINFTKNRHLSAGFEQLPVNALPRLKIAKLARTQITAAAVSALFRAGPSLEKVDLSDCCHIEDGLSQLKPKALLSLMEINLTQCGVNANAVHALLEAAPNLETMLLNGCRNLDDAFLSHKPKTLLHLKVIRFGRGGIGPKAIRTLLKAAPLLKEIDLDNCGNLDNALDLQPNDLAQLEAISLMGNDFATVSMQKLSTAAPKLESISLCNGENINTAFSSLEPNALFRLKEIDLSGSDVNADSILILSKAAPNLQILDLSSCENDHYLLSKLEPNSLRQLQKIILEDSKINADSIHTLAKAAPKLQKMNLCNCENLENILSDLKPNEFPQLREIDVYHDDTISRDSLICLLLSAPSLEQCRWGSQTLSKNEIETARKCIAAHDDHGLDVVLGLREPDPSKSTQTAAHQEPHLAFSKIEKTIITDNQLNLRTEPLPAKKILHPLDGSFSPEIHPAFYRNRVYQIDNDNACFTWIEPSPGSRITISNNPADPRSDTITLKADSHYYYGLDKVKLAPSETYTVTTRTIADAIPHIRVRDESGRLLSENEISIFYDLIYNRTCIENHSDKPITFSVDYLLKTPKTPEDYNLGLHSASSIPGLSELIATCSTFGVPNSEQMTTAASLHGTALLDYCYKNKIGACRHRCQVFLHKLSQLQKKPGVSAIMNSNGVHAYIELFIEGRWQKINLGGYPAKLSITTQDFSTVDKKAAFSTTLEPEQTHATSPKLTSLRAFAQRAFAAKSPARPYDNWPDACRTILSPDKKSTSPYRQNRLLVTDSNQAGAVIHALHTATSESVFYIDSPEQMRCIHAALQFVSDEQQTETDWHAIVQREADTALKQWLQHAKDHPQSRPILVINWHHFKSEEITSMHGIVDGLGSERGKVDGMIIPKNVTIVSIAGTSYWGRDFTGRHSKTVKLAKDIEFPTWDKSNEASNDPLIVDLSDGEHDWFMRLVGNWQLCESGFVFIPGPLINAIWQNRPIRLDNIPSTNAAFVDFWQRLLKEKSLTIANKTFALPESFKWSSARSDHWPQYRRAITTITTEVTDTIQASYHVNPNTLGNFIANYRLATDNRLLSAPGWLQSHENQEMDCLLTHPLSLGEWQRLLTTAVTHNVKLNLSVAPGVTIPDQIHGDLVIKKFETEQKTTAQACQVFIPSTPGRASLDAVVRSLKKQYPDALLVEITDVDASHLLYRLSLLPEQSQNGLLVAAETSDILSRLLRDEPPNSVILKGELSPQLAQALSHLLAQGRFWQNGQWHNIHGRLFLISPDGEHLNFLPASCKKVVRPLDEPMDAKPAATITTTTTAKPENFMQQRLDRLYQTLAQSPSGMLFIHGPTAAGKSTFMRKVVPEDNQFDVIEYHAGDNQALIEWVTASSKPRILFVDEANVAALHQLAPFYDFEHGTILIGSKIYTIPTGHKIVFAGNPTSYSNNRTEHPLFAKATPLSFDALPNAFLQTQILDPLRPKHLAVEKWLAICKLFLGVKDRLSQFAPDIFLTARELTTMAHSVSDNTTIEQAKKIAWDYSHHLLSPSRQQLLKAYLQIPDPDQHELSEATNKKLINLGHYIGPSRTSLHHSISRLLQTRALKIKNHRVAPGIAGMMLTGAPGVGKSSFITTVLKAQGFREGSYQNLLSPSPNPNPNRYYYLQPELSLAQKQQAIEIACLHGLVLIIDELDTLEPETLLNRYLGGAQEKNTAPVHPGTLILGTGNGAGFQGRSEPSLALKHRLIYENMTEMPLAELQAWCAAFTTLPEATANTLCEEYLHACTRAQHDPSQANTVSFRLFKQKALELDAQQQPALRSPPRQAVAHAPITTRGYPHFTFATSGEQKQTTNNRHAPHPDRPPPIFRT